jgi:predicted RNase H-like HicB family nuclease
MTLDEYVAWPWRPTIRPDGDGGMMLTVEPLEDFAVYGASESEVRSMWKEALRSHLAGYLQVGKAIPELMRAVE